MKKIIILGAAGEIAQQLTQRLLKADDVSVVLYGRNIKQRLGMTETAHVKLIDGDFNDLGALTPELQDADFVYLNAMESGEVTQRIIAVLAQYDGIRFIGASMAGIENEVPQALSDWTIANLSPDYIEGEIASANNVKASALDYTLVKLTWLYNGGQDDNYELIPEGMPFRNAEVSREAVVHFIYQMMMAQDQTPYSRVSIGIGEPDTYFDKPSFY